MKIYRVIGLMSGTSLDGIDAALLRTDGESYVEREAFVTLPYNDDLREEIRACLGTSAAEAVDVEKKLTIAHVAAVKELLQGRDIVVDFIGFHGQTIAHAPAEGYTTQIGDAALLSALTGIRVVNDFRSADVKAGGQGAPLVPVYHQALAAGLQKPVAFLNIGGVANVTYVEENNDLLAFDTGPGNALINDWMWQKVAQHFDDQGKTAAAGVVDQGILDKLLSHPFFSAPVPKSLDRDAFVSEIYQGLSLQNGAATLTAFTVQSIVQAEKYFPAKPKQWVISGGGRHNLYMLAQLKKHLQAPVIAIEELGLNGDAIEAEAFGYLAVRSVKGLPISFPTTTGAPQPMTGGRLCA